MECNEQGKRWRGYYITAYGISVKHGFKGTEAEWLETLKGDKVQLRYNEDTKTLEWKYEDADEWLELMDINALQGEVVTEVLEQATAAKEAAETAQAGAEAAQEAAESARTGAETAAASAAEQAAAAGKSAAAAAQDAQNAAAAKAGAESARDAAEAAKSEAQESAASAQESATQAEEAQEAAESAKSGAEVAQKAAETAQGAAADAQAGAESAKTAAEAAADVAAKDAAEGVREELSVYVEQTEANAQAAADSASEAAVSQEAAAQSAQGAAGSATAAAQDAVDAADARTAAEAAQGKAEAAQGAAEAAKSGAETAAGTATTKAEEASASAETAKQYSGKPPKPQNGTWWVWNAETQAYTDTGIKSVLSIVKSYPSVEAMEADKLNMHEGDLVIIASTVDDPDNSKLYVHDGVGWVYLSDLSGVEGVGIAGISQTDGNHAPGTTDTYTIELTNGSSYEFTVYNGADGDGSGDMQSSTYDPQGKAQDIFGYADNAAKGKQDKLKGTAGQVVGFDSEGNAIPQAAPSGLPDGGTVGQLLEKTEDGAEWADKPVMYVNITPPAGDSPFGTADHTIAEITQAVLNGVTVLSKISAGTDTKVIPLSSVTDSVASFSSTSVDYGGSVIANIVPQEQSEVVIIAEDQFRASQILYDKGTSGLDSDDVQGAIKELAKNKQDSADAVTVPGGGTMQMGESLGNGPYTIEVTEDGEGGGLSAEQVGYSNTGSGLDATNVQEAIDELAGRGSSGVITFNGRSGAVVPQEGDYTANMVGALPNSTKLADLPADESHRTVSDTEKSAWNNKGDPAKSTTITLLSSGWTQGGDGRYSQTVACSIVAADTAVVSVDVALSGTDLDADAEALNAWMGPSAQNAVQGAGTLTFYAAEAPTVNIPVNGGVG